MHAGSTCRAEVALRGVRQTASVRGGCHTSSRRGCTGERAWGPPGLLRSGWPTRCFGGCPEGFSLALSGPGDPRRPRSSYGRCVRPYRTGVDANRSSVVRARCPRQGRLNADPCCSWRSTQHVPAWSRKGATMAASMCAFLLNPPFGRAVDGVHWLASVAERPGRARSNAFLDARLVLPHARIGCSASGDPIVTPQRDPSAGSAPRSGAARRRSPGAGPHPPGARRARRSLASTRCSRRRRPITRRTRRRTAPTRTVAGCSDCACGRIPATLSVGAARALHPPGGVRDRRVDAAEMPGRSPPSPPRTATPTPARLRRRVRCRTREHGGSAAHGRSSALRHAAVRSAPHAI